MKKSPNPFKERGRFREALLQWWYCSSGFMPAITLAGIDNNATRLSIERRKEEELTYAISFTTFIQCNL